MRTAGSELVEDQEIYRRVSIVPASGRFITDVLLESRLVRVCGAVPAQRPDRSAGGPGGVAAGYTLSNPDGDDGAPLTDYDIIGASGTGTGLFALDGSTRFNLLCIPPLTRERDVGLSTLLVAARLCRERHALLVVDPPAPWSGAARGARGAAPVAVSQRQCASCTTRGCRRLTACAAGSRYLVPVAPPPA